MNTNQDTTQTKRVLRQTANWQNLRFYRKSDVLCQLTHIFCVRFLPPHGDRTVDQMEQAARSCKQNIVEGSEDGATSTEMELKLINVARASNDELREDYLDFIKKQQLPLWSSEHPRYESMQSFTRAHNDLDDYLPHANSWTAEEFSNVCLTLCYQVDAMINRYLKHLENEFIEKGGIKERMYAARTGYREGQDAKMKQLMNDFESLKKENDSLKTAFANYQARYNDIRDRALKAYHQQQEIISKQQATINALRQMLETKSREDD